MPHKEPVFNQLNVVCGDVEASIAFYRRLGVPIPDERVWRTGTGAHHAGAMSAEGDEAAQLELDSAVFAPLWNAGWCGVPALRGRVVVGFEVGARGDVDRLHGEMVAAGHRILQVPFDAYWGARYAVIEDPDGIAVGLMSDVSAEHRSPPPQV